MMVTSRVRNMAYVHKKNFWFVTKFIFGMLVDFMKGKEFFVIAVETMVISKSYDEANKHFEALKHFAAI